MLQMTPSVPSSGPGTGTVVDPYERVPLNRERSRRRGTSAKLPVVRDLLQDRAMIFDRDSSRTVSDMRPEPLSWRYEA